MDHNQYENQMIDGINRHAEDQSPLINSTEGVTKDRVFTKEDARTMGRGIKRMAIALITATLFALAANSFILVGTKVGWLAVAAFLAGIVLLFLAVLLLYAQGIIRIERSGEN